MLEQDALHIHVGFGLIIILKTIIMRKILSAEIILSAYMHAHKHTHTGAHTHKHTDCAKLNLHNLKQAAKNRLRTYEDSSMGWKT